MKFTCKGLDGEEYQLKETTQTEPDKVHLPDQKIIPIPVFGPGFYLTMEQIEGTITEVSPGGPSICLPSAVVTKIYEKEGKTIIEAEKKTEKQEKLVYVNDILEKVDFENGFANEIFTKMLTNVFSEEKLKEILAAEDPEMLLFNSWMYLKTGNKAYRL